ncbi:hypothetical protein SAMN05660657_03603 [Geodermatophilus amargosae]|uniref:Uncharacterized protein n=1 Tax=Geodermatophilus amargosae TaxID=1296565 RepID=A0A1I7BIC9_9ACTN|nr:hypothetical protein [Geodermatophilus amargosae]SFT86917.1 hypothetical protein SAMN05660657_03603 [Geodermatophilus amargosae]
MASTFSAALRLLATLTVLSRGGVTTVPVPYSFSARAFWALTAILGVGAVTIAASPSNWERFGWAPFVLVLAVLSLRRARSPIDGHGRIPDTIERSGMA